MERAPHSPPPPPADLHCVRGALSAVLERSRLLYDGSPLMYLLLDGEGVVMDGNRRAMRGLCREPHELIGRPFCELLHEESRGPLLARLAPPPPGGPEAPEALELRLVTPSGDLYTSATFTATRAEDGTAVEVHVMMLDISEVRRLQQRMMQADRLASVGHLAAGVAHEINNPASWVISNLTYLQERMPLLDELCRGGSAPRDGRAAAALLSELPRLCAESLDGMYRIRDIVRDLQLFAREPRERRERIDVNTLCDTVTHMAWPQIRRHARLEKSYGAPPPIYCDAGRVSQVLLNLVINAAQAIGEGDQGRNKIVVSTAAAAGGAAITVRDTGCGIPRSVLPRIFDPFFTTKAPGKGTGLGLSVSYEIVRAHGGRIDVESEIGAGTSFTIWLPPGEAPAEEAAPAPRPATRSAPAAHGKVLVIDDEPELLRALERTLKPRHDVILAGSGEEALRQLGTHRDVDVVLCDVMMPETSGMDLYESLPGAVRDRFIFMSGDTASAAVHAFLDSVKGPHLPKPVEPAELLRTVDRAVQIRRMTDA